MAPKTRTKPNTRARMQRLSTQFSELDVTPSRPDDKNHHFLSEKGKLPLSEVNTDERPLADYEAGVSVFDETQQDITTATSFAWSDAGSTNVTRRSSPVPLDDFPAEELWDFDNEDDEVVRLFESCESKNQNLPDTIPLVRENQAKEMSITPGHQVDFSETASSIRRSSPYMTSDARRDLWDFSDSLASSESPLHTAKHDDKTEALNPVTSHRIPMDDIYDATPRKTDIPDAPQITVEPKAKKPKTVSVTQSYSAATALHQKVEPTCQSSSRATAKTKKRQQKAKEPIKFDPLTQEIIDLPKSKKNNPPLKLSIVSALQESAKESSSPFVSAKKTSRKQAPKQKQQRARQAKRRKPEAEVAQHNESGIVVLDSSPAQVVVDSPPEIPQDLPCVHRDEEMKASQPIRMENISNPNQAPKERRHQTSLAANEVGNGSESLPTDHTHFKRRKLSRQFSISEKGSPVVTRDAAPMNKVDPAISEPDPFLTNHANPVVTEAQPPSFLRTASSDKLYGQQLDSAVGGVDGKASSRWLRRMDEQKPRLKHNSSTGRNIHDNIMKSFLGAAETLQGLQDSRPRSLAEMGDRSQIERQIWHVAEVSNVQNKQFKDVGS
jgi:hypothetical protein